MLDLNFHTIMNSELKLALDEQLVSGILSPEDYLKSVQESLNSESDSVKEASQTRPGQHHLRPKHRIRPWMWGVAVPVLLLIRFDQMPRTPVRYDPSQYALSSLPSGGASPSTPNREKLRDYYEQTGPRDIFALPSQLPSRPNTNPQQHGGQSMSQEDAFALGLIMSPLLQQQQAHAQQQELARQQQQMQQQMLRQQAEAQRQQQAAEWAQRFQSGGMPEYARPRSSVPSAPFQTQQIGGPYIYVCDRCSLTQTYSVQPAVPPRCPRENGFLRLRR